MSLGSQESPPCHIPSLFPTLILYNRNNTHTGICTVTTDTPTHRHAHIHTDMRTHTGATHSSRRHGQIGGDTLEPSREPPCTSSRGGQKRKPVSHVGALGQLYKTVIHTHARTHTHTDTHMHTQTVHHQCKAAKDYKSPCCLVELCCRGRKSERSLLQFRNIIRAPSLLFNTPLKHAFT